MLGRFVQAGSTTLWCETFGVPTDPAVLLLMGNSLPGLHWPDSVCAQLADAGFHLVRFDQRDTGLSTYVDYDVAPYDLLDLVADAVQLLDALAIDRAHLVGLSQGGALAYRLAGRHPGRARSVVTIMASIDFAPKDDAFAGRAPRPGALPPPNPDFVAGVIEANAVRPTTDEGAVAQLVANFRLAKGPRSPFDESYWHALMARMLAWQRQRADGKAPKMANHGNHARAQAATPQVPLDELRHIAVPVLVIHGTHDPIFPPAHAEAAAAAVPGARLLLIPDMGHALDPAFFAPITSAILEHLRHAAT